ncbi:MAG TPA: cation:proton antiporter, partial [Thermoanaerobaculia bacterium]|nr:cation:proton antiporter [Thermoanaerobaculia bacterium]
MLEAEILNTAGLMAVAGLLMATSVLFSRASARFGFPVFLLFLAVGMLAGSEGIGGVEFSDYGFSLRLGTLALALILFDGGLNTPVEAFRRSSRPASVLATLGVAGTMAGVAVAGRLLGLTWSQAFLLGAIISSTDAAVVFAVLRASGLQLRGRVGTTLELESGLNDPMAVILTTELTLTLAEGRSFSAWSLLEVPLQLAVGAGLGLAFGYAARWLLRWSRLSTGGLYPVFTLGITLLAFGVPTLLHGSGFLGVYLAGVVLGNGDLPYQAGLRRFHDAAAWFGQVSM